MVCVYGPQSPKKSQMSNVDVEASTSKVELKPLAEGPTGMNVNDEVEDAFGPLVFNDESISDCILDNILIEESEGFLESLQN